MYDNDGEKALRPLLSQKRVTVVHLIELAWPRSASCWSIVQLNNAPYSILRCGSVWATELPCSVAYKALLLAMEHGLEQVATHLQHEHVCTATHQSV